MLFRQLFDPTSSSYSYLLADEQTRRALLIDPVLDQVERDAKLVEELGLTLVYTLETHAHADHITGCARLRSRLGSQAVVGAKMGVHGADRELRDGEVLELDGLALEARATPGHTAGCVSYVTADTGDVFTGDALLIRGCGRTDFQQGDAATLYRSIHERIFTLPDATRVWPAHDYRGFTMSTVGEEKRHNLRLGAGRSEADFIEIMAELHLSLPRHIDVALPANMQCGVTVADLAAGRIAAIERGWAKIERTEEGVPEVSPTWLVRHGRGVPVIDVRDPDELDGPLGAFAGAELVPYPTLEDAARDWDREQPLVLVCRSGGRSGRAAVILENEGFKRVASMRGGLLALDEATD